MTINFEQTKRLQKNIHNAVDALNHIEYWLKIKSKYTKNDLGKWAEDGKQLAFNEYTSQSIDDYLLGILWRLSFPIIFHCTDEELPNVIENNYGGYSNSYKRMLLDIAREQNPRIDNIEQEFIQNLSSYNPDSISNLINIYRAQWKGHIPHVTIQFDYFQNSYEDKEHPLYNILHDAESNKLLDFGEIHLILSRLDWIANALKSIEKDIYALFDKWQNTTHKEPIVQDETSSETKSSKVQLVAIMEILTAAGIGKNTTDLTKIVRIAAFLMGKSYKGLYNDANKGIIFNKSFHQKDIDEINKLFKDVNSTIKIDIDKEY